MNPPTGGDVFSNWFAPFCCTDSRREDLQSSLTHGHKPADVTRQPSMKKEMVANETGFPSPSQKCGCGIIFAADMEGKLVVDGFVHGGSAETSRMIMKGLMKACTCIPLK
jgi:hypothetical protein